MIRNFTIQRRENTKEGPHGGRMARTAMRNMQNVCFSEEMCGFKKTFQKIFLFFISLGTVLAII